MAITSDSEKYPSKEILEFHLMISPEISPRFPSEFSLPNFLLGFLHIFQIPGQESMIGFLLEIMLGLFQVFLLGSFQKFMLGFPQELLIAMLYEFLLWTLHLFHQEISWRCFSNNSSKKKKICRNSFRIFLGILYGISPKISQVLSRDSPVVPLVILQGIPAI